MGELRTLRKRVVAAQKKLKDARHTEFIGVVQNQPAILAEHHRLSQSLKDLEVCQPYVVWNYASNRHDLLGCDSEQTVIHLPSLPRSVQPLVRIQGAARLLFEPS